MIVVIVTVIYLSTIITILLFPSITYDRQHSIRFESADIELSAIPLEISNPSFESSDERLIEWEPIVWAGDATFRLDTNKSRTGWHSAFISAKSTVHAALVTNSSNKISVVSGETYLASAWIIANITKGNGARISIAWFDSDEAYITTTHGLPISNASNWTKISVSGPAPERAVSAQLELHLEGVGSLWYDDISFSQVISEYDVKGFWNISRQGLDEAKLTANPGSLTLKGTFAFPFDEKLTYTMPVDLDTNEYTLLTITYKTNTANGSGMLIVLNYVDGTKMVTYGTSFSNEWTVAYIDPRKTPAYIYYLGNRQTAPGKQLSSIEISLDDRPDTVSSGTYQLQVGNITFYRFVTQDLLLLGESALLLASLVILGVRGLEPMRGLARYVLLLMFGATLSFVAASAIFLLPLPVTVASTEVDFYLTLQLIGAVIVLFGVIAKISIARRRPNFKEKVSNVVLIGWIIGLFLIPSMSFLIRANNALTLPMFDDELSYGIAAWGLTRGSLVGLNLAVLSPEAQALIETGYFKVQPWPTNLPVPFTSTALYPDFTIVEPYFAHPFLGPLIVAPFISLLGFNSFAVRLPFILFNIATAVLIFLIAARKGHILPGLIGSSFFGFVPYISHYGSEAFLDNILAFFLMISVYFILKYSEAVETPKRERSVYISVAFAAFCTLIKIQGVFVSFFLLAALYLLGCTKKTLLRGVLLYIALVLLYPITGFLGSPQAFLLSLKGMLSIGLSSTAQISPESSGIFSLLDLFRHWDVVIALLCVVYLLAENTGEKRLLLWGAVSWILYGLLFSYKEWYLISFFAIAALLVGYVFSDLVTKQKLIWTILLTPFLSIFSLEKLGASLLQILAFMAPLVLLVFGTAYLERNGSNYSKQARSLLLYLIALYLIVSFVLMIVTSWNYKYWA